ncbi:MaoC/PaaZ C-terminal domain-containing protein [Xinfangfangia sp. CPCC 101601]|uniref:MaoC/PaaZ C-terminal domain-containing protein n=1 Tax=Pseudogemmobacter lacusdianii TaxID=3069608 RepID=A0ABU0VT42_9RHOB|nr:MaoC/PaaZ C-terminal domain-containing protein [Xinfangfangia sp. CPCC 101601]MDQ2064838.1 MaoC/PaaZ C-terminal domain-containing protein [Xinfangfangia sp. CPCC 101601]
MADFHVQPGQTWHFRKTVSESDVYLFAGITGDLSPNHVDEAAMRQTPYGGRIAHGALIVGYMSACSTMACADARGAGETPVSLGYDSVRFLAGVPIGTTIAISYQIASIDEAARRSQADVRVEDAETGKLLAVAKHILKWVPNA